MEKLVQKLHEIYILGEELFTINCQGQTNPRLLEKFLQTLSACTIVKYCNFYKGTSVLSEIGLARLHCNPFIIHNSYLTKVVVRLT